MAIPFSSLFSRWGKLAGSLNKADDYHRDTVASRTSLVESAYSANPEVLGGLTPASEAATLAGSGWSYYLSQVAQTDLVAVVDADNPQPDKGVYTAASELIRQMEAAGQTVAPVDVDVAVTPFSTNNGTAWWVSSTKYPNGKTCVYSHPEDLVARVVADGQPGGGSTVGRERISISGEYSIGGPLDPRYPRGSATRVSLAAVSPEGDSEGGFGNWLRNGDFNEWDPISSALSAEVPSYWTIAAGTVGVAVFEDPDSGYGGTSCMVFESNGSTQTRVYQQFATLAGTLVEMQPLQQFAVCVRMKSGSGALTGTLRIALVDGSNTVINDQQGVPNSVSIPLAGVGTSWSVVSASFRTPLVLPGTVRLEFRLTSPPASGKLILIDHAAMTRMVPLYSYGPSVAVFSSNDPLIRGDSWSIRVSTSCSSKSWHRAFDRLVGGAAMGLVLPVAGYGQTPTISSALIDHPPGATEPGELSGGGLSSGWDDDGLESLSPIDPGA